MQKGLRSTSVVLVGLDGSSGLAFSFNNPSTEREVFGYKIQYLITNVNFVPTHRVGAEGKEGSHVILSFVREDGTF